MAKLMWTEPIKKEWNITAGINGTTDFQYDSDTVYSVNTLILQLLNAGVINTVFSPVSIMYLNKDLSDMGYYGRLWRVGAEMKF